MSELASNVVIDKGGMTVNGEPFPWFIHKEDIQVTLSPDGIHKVMVPLLFEGTFNYTEETDE